MKITESFDVYKSDGEMHHPACDRFVISHSKSRQRGFTLIEVSAAFMMMMILSGTIVTLLSQHVFFMQMYNNASFLSEEAPRINALVSSIVNQADSYFIFSNLTDAQNLGGATPVTSGGTAVRLTFRNPSGETDESILSYAGGTLNYHYKRLGVWSTTPDWVVTSQPKSATFSNDLGLLLIRLVGPEDEVIEFVGTSE